ncbi:MAG: hypothetical protein IT376_05460 [Polyangiaceae bacterium]|nr:hypothetical protein [Polyangiaceae bacterium]
MMPPPGRGGVRLFALGTLTASTLALEVFLTRLLSYTVPTLLVYLVLGVAMAGFGLASAWLTRRGATDRPPPTLAGWSAGFSISLVVCSAIFTRLSPWLTWEPYYAPLAALLLTIPFFAVGVAVTHALASAGPALGRTYAADLFGSGLGCALPFLLLPWLGGERLIAALAALGAVASVLFVVAEGPERPRRVPRLPLAALAIGGGSFVLAPACFPILREPLGQVAIMERHGTTARYRMRRVIDRWNSVGRVEVFVFDGAPGGADYPFRFYAQDGTAGALIARWDGRDRLADPPEGPDPRLVARICSDTLFGQGWYQPRQRALVIGIGGGIDLQCALYHRAAHVDAVEINPDTVAIHRGQLAAELGGIGTDPRVHWHVRDGRSFARAAAPASYDIVQLSGVDTKQHLASGSLSLSENQLYTREAFDDYLRALAPGGLLSIIYFGEPALLRLVGTALDALAARGAADPTRHLLVLGNAEVYGILVHREPLDEARLAAFRAHVQFTHRPFRGFHAPFLDPFGYETWKRPKVLYTPEAAADRRIADLAAAHRSGDVAAVRSGSEWNVEPVTDDRPFFFDTARYDRPGLLRISHVQALGSALLAVLVLALAGALWPVRRFARGLGGRRVARAGAVFAGVGLGFLGIEVWLLHRFATYLGHQTYSLGAVLGVLLVAGGAGSWLAPRWIPTAERRMTAGAALVVALTVLVALVTPPLFAATGGASLGARTAVALGLLTPLGLAMGSVFPAGLAWLARSRESALPWAIGVNFFTSVLATVGVVPLALACGYRAVLVAGIAAYALVALVGAGSARHEPPAPSA